MTYQPKHFEFDRFGEWKEGFLLEEMQADARGIRLRHSGRRPGDSGPGLKPGTLGWAIKEALEEHGPMTLEQIGSAVGRTRSQIATTIYRWRDREFLVIGQGPKPKSGRAENLWGVIE